MNNIIQRKATMENFNAVIQDIDALYKLDKGTQLELLRREITYVLQNELQPTQEWYEARTPLIYNYQTVNWSSVINRFNGKDPHMHLTASNITVLLALLEDQLSVSAYFNLNTYYKLLDEIHHIWTYYRQHYVGDETDEDVIDLVEMVSFL